MATVNKKVSLVITFHNEGIFAHRTIRNMLDFLQPLQKEKKPYEVIFHLDNGDDLTRKILKQYADDKTILLYENNFGSPSASRNFAAERATGDYIALIDGDDILSLNWLIDGYKILSSRSNEDIILHFEYNITFGSSTEPPRLWRMSNSRSKIQDTLTLFTRNRWASGTFAKKSIIHNFKYKKSDRGFGYEDWVYNMDTRQADIRHEIIPDSIQFYRIKPSSVMKIHDSENVVTDYSDMFSLENLHQIIADSNVLEEETVMPKAPLIPMQKVAHLAFNLSKRVPIVRSLAERYATHRKENISQTKISPKLHREWNLYNKYDGDIYITTQRLADMPIYNSDYDYLGHIYLKLISQIRKNPDYLFLPWQLNVGGTEKVIVNYLNAFAELHPDWHVVVLSSIPKKNPYNIPDNVDFVDFHQIVASLGYWERSFLLSRLIIQTKVKRLHIIHNSFAYEWVREHLTLLTANHYTVYASHFMYEYTEDSSLKIGLIDPYISNAYPAITKIFTDNQYVIDEAVNIDGFEPEKLSVHYQPLELTFKKPHERSKKDKTHILWASRISLQKRPDILKQIAEKLDPEKYIIDVYGRFQEPYNKNYFKGAKTINYKGVYNGIESLDIDKYDVFLYTSQTDGLPNVLLEIMALGLPIVASKVGGVSDIVQDHKTGFLTELDDINGYIKNIRQAASSKESAKMVERGQKLIKKRHTWQTFIDAVKKDIV